MTFYQVNNTLTTQSTLNLYIKFGTSLSILLMTDAINLLNFYIVNVFKDS